MYCVSRDHDGIKPVTRRQSDVSYFRKTTRLARNRTDSRVKTVLAVMLLRRLNGLVCEREEREARERETRERDEREREREVRER